jgi:anti-sigma factor RsiW
MRCEQALKGMAEALDGELSPDRQAALEDHLARCADCRAEWDRWQAVERLLREAPITPPPAGFAGRVLARLDWRRRVRRAALGGLALAAGTAIVAFLAVAPAIWTLPDLAGGLLALSRTGPVLLTHLADAAGVLLNSLWLTVGALALPAAPMALCGLTVALVGGLVWLGLIRWLQPVRVTVRR